MADYSAVTPLTTGQVIPATEWTKIVNNFTAHQDVQTILITNNTGGTVTRGFVGILDPATQLSLIATTTQGDARRVVVVSSPTILNGAQGYVQIIGRVSTVTVHGAVALYDALETYSAAGEAHVGYTAPFAMALTTFAGPGVGMVAAIMAPGMGGGTFPLGTPDGTHGPFAFHINDTSLHAAEIAAPGTGLSIYIVNVRVQNFNTTASLLSVIAAAGHTEIYVIPGVVGGGLSDDWGANQKPWKIGDNVAVNLQQSALADLYGHIDFYVATS